MGAVANVGRVQQPAGRQLPLNADIPLIRVVRSKGLVQRRTRSWWEMRAIAPDGVLYDRRRKCLSDQFGTKVFDVRVVSITNGGESWKEPNSEPRGEP